MLSQHYTYLLIDVLCIIVPLVASFHPKSPFYKDWKYYLPANLVVALAFLAWDALFTDMGIWGFNAAYITGIKVYNLPIEEILFFICIPYACTYTYFVFSSYVKTNFPAKAGLVCYVLAAVLSFIALMHLNQLYTSVTFFMLSVLLLFMALAKVKFMDRFFVVYLVMLIPFFISNGLLTGSMLDEPIVWYNDNHNLSIRMFTIPVEDSFYGMLLLLLNISGYEWIKARYTKEADNSFSSQKKLTLKGII